MFVPKTDSAYKILGVDRDSSVEDLKKAYRKMANKCHPDKVSHLGEDFRKAAKEKFQKVNEAYIQIKKERKI
ncbi:Co-chaperone protein DjlA [subsurface metagenome]